MVKSIFINKFDSNDSHQFRCRPNDIVGWTLLKRTNMTCIALDDVMFGGRVRKLQKISSKMLLPAKALSPYTLMTLIRKKTRAFS